jgi:hypothetical protein
MGDVLETGIATVNHVMQTAKGAAPDFTAAVSPADRPKWDDGVLDPAKTLGEKDYIDGQAFSSPTVWTKEVGGDVGSYKIQAQPENTGVYFAEILASDTVTGAGDPWTHTITSGNGAQRYGAWAQAIGQNVAPQKHIFSDAQLAKVVAESTHDDGVLMLDLAIMALKAGEIYTTAAAKGENGSDPYLHSEQSGQITLDGTVIGDVDSTILEVDRPKEAWFGDSHTPAQLIPKRGAISQTIKSIATSDTLLKRNKALYGVTNPGVGLVPVKDVFYMSVTRKYVRSATRSVEFQTPKMVVEAGDLKLSATKDGSAAELTFGGKCLKSGVTPALTVIVKSGDSTPYYV